MMKKVEKFVSENRLIAADDTVLCALSGGVDSVVMLHILQKLSQKLHFSVAAAHINHKIRGADADADADFCRELAATLNIPFHSQEIDILALAKAQKIGLEECGREARYDYFQRLSSVHGYRKIATAHHLSDNLETVLLHLTRGCGGGGLSGISPVRDGSDGAKIIRPLLNISKEEILRYAAENDLKFVTDESNFDKKYSRNRIRQDVLPAIFALNPKADLAVWRLCQSLRQDEDFVQTEVEKLPLKMPISDLKTVHGSLLSRYIRRKFDDFLNETHQQKTTLDYLHIEQISAKIRTYEQPVTLSVGGDNLATINESGFSFAKKPETDEKIGFFYQLKFGENDFSDHKIKIFISRDKNIAIDWQNIYKMSILTAVKNDKILNSDTLSLSIRSRREKDAYRFKNHTRVVKKELIAARVPASERGKLPFFCHGEALIWVPFLPVQDDYRAENDENAIFIVYAKTP